MIAIPNELMGGPDHCRTGRICLSVILAEQTAAAVLTLLNPDVPVERAFLCAADRLKDSNLYTLPTGCSS